MSFFPRDAMSKRGLRCRLSVTFMYCIQTTEDIVKLLSWLGNPMILVFDPKPRYQFQPLQRGCKIHGGEKNLQDRPMVAMEH